MDAIKNQARQGDVLIMRTEKTVDDSAKKEPRENGQVVLAHGENTGHMHGILHPSVHLFRMEEDRLLVVGAPALLRHDEHAPIKISKGTFEVIRQREYLEGQIQNVAD